MKRSLLRALPFFLASFSLMAVSTVHAQESGSGALNVQPLEEFFGSLISIVNDVVVPVVFAIAFVTFLWGVYTYFIAGGASEEKRSEGTKFVMWAVIGFVIMISLWGIVNLVNTTLPFGDSNQPSLPHFDNTTGSESGDGLGGDGGDGSTCTPACTDGKSCVHGECLAPGEHGACIGGEYADGTPC